MDLFGIDFSYDGKIPDYMVRPLQGYIMRGEATGDFLYALLSNDLKRCIDYADDVNVRHLPEYVRFLVNRVPCGCWGSPEEVTTWQIRGGIFGGAFIDDDQRRFDWCDENLVAIQNYASTQFGTRVVRVTEGGAR